MSTNRHVPVAQNTDRPRRLVAAVGTAIVIIGVAAAILLLY